MPSLIACGTESAHALVNVRLKEVARYKKEKKKEEGTGQRESLRRALDRSLREVLARR